MSPETPPKGVLLQEVDDEEEERGAQCRVCWEHESEANLLSPCKCAGERVFLRPNTRAGRVGVGCRSEVQQVPALPGRQRRRPASALPCASQAPDP